MVTLASLQGVLNTFVIFLARIIGSASGFMRLFMTHPPLDERIAALQTLGTV
jgi:Zn-dependent protease with chaperone function